MRRIVAPLATVLAALAIVACGDDGAEPGASDEATLVLDFQPNAVHSGIYAALGGGEYGRRGIELEVREPSASTDAPKLLAAGEAEFAILDIHDLAIAREGGLDLVGIAAIAQRPLAAVIAADREAIREPGDLAGATVGVTGLPSDEAVLDSVLAAGRLSPESADWVTIGFDSIAGLASGRLDAATAFWNAEGVALRRRGLPTREFRVDDYGAPPYPELVLVTAAETLERDPELAAEMVAATAAGYRRVVDDPDGSLTDLLDAVEELDPAEQEAQLDALLAAGALGPGLELDRRTLVAWARWDAAREIVSAPPRIGDAFALEIAR